MKSAAIISTLSLLGSFLLLLGVLLLINPAKNYAQEESKEYMGIRECRDCHGRLGRAHLETPHGQTLTAISDDEETTILADFSLAPELRTVQFPDEAAPRPFTAEDVAYTLGSGRNRQAYVFLAADGSYFVFPAQWNTNDNSWQPLMLDESWPASGYDFVQNCAYCHVTGFDAETAQWEDDGVQCEACHGPGSVHVELMDDIEEVETAEDRVALNESINIAVDAQVCGQCHSRGTAPDGSHPYPLGYQPGDQLDDSFTLVSTEDSAFWFASGHASQPYMQYNEWMQSKHAAAYTTAANSEFFNLECLNCHGESYRRAVNLLADPDADPEILPIPDVEAERLPIGVTCSSCHDPHAEQSDEDAPPPDTAQIEYEQCTACHHSSSDIAVRHHPVQEMFEGRPIIAEIAPIVGIHFSAAGGPRCNTCHVPQIPTENGTRSSHLMMPVLPAFALDSPLQDSCTQCHDTINGQSMQDLVERVQSNIKMRHERAQNALTDTSPQWVAQTLDIIAGDGSWGIHNYAYTNQMLIAVETELGLIGASTDLVLPQVPTYEAPMEAQVTEQYIPGEIVFGLTWPSLLLMIFTFGLLIFSAWAFFRGEDES